MTTPKPLRVHHFSDGHGATVVALHGFGGCAADFKRLARHSRFNVVAIDLLGHGSSSRSDDANDYSANRQVDQVFHTMPVEPPILLGYSMGGRLALHFALTYPRSIRALVVIGAHAGLDDDVDRQNRLDWDEANAIELLRNGTPNFMKAWASIPLISTQGQRMSEHDLAEMQTRRSRGDAGALAASLRGFGSGTMPSCWHRLKTLRIPTLVIVGADDRRYQALQTRLVDAIPNAEAAKIVDAGHAPQLENPLETAKCIASFIERIEQGTWQ